MKNTSNETGCKKHFHLLQIFVNCMLHINKFIFANLYIGEYLQNYRDSLK